MAIAGFAACPLGKLGFQAHVAQAVEHFLGKEEVTGSSPVVGSNLFGAQIAAGILIRPYI